MRPHPIAWLREHPFVADSMLAALLTIVSIAGLWLGAEHMHGKNIWRHADVLGVVLVGLRTLPIAWRRRKPDLVFVCVGAATIAFYAAGYAPTVGPVPAHIAFYTLAAYRTRERLIWPGVLAVAGVVACLLLGRGNVGFGDVIGNLAIFAAAWFIGDTVRNRRARTAALIERAERLEREREANSRQAVADERARIARELHDVVAHSMSVMVVQAGAARRVIDEHPSQAVEALQSIEETGRRALDEMRRLLGVLRHDHAESKAELAPQPSVRDLESLVESVREAGLTVVVKVHGTPGDVPSGIDLSAYRIVQEALTNSLKHAHASSAAVTLRWTEHDLALDVTDDGRGLPPANTHNGSASGHGLVGMRERVNLFGGELSVGTAPGGGFRVSARLPLATTSHDLGATT